MAEEPASNQETRPVNDHKEHYESLISLFKYCVTIGGFLLGVASIYVSYVAFKDGQEMRQDRRDAREEIREFLKEMRTDIREERDRMEKKTNESKAEIAEQGKQLSIKESEMAKSVANLDVTARNEIAAAKGDALRAISGVKSEATTVARNSVREVFEQRNLGQFIETEVKTRLGPKVQSLVDSQATRLDKKLNDFNRDIDNQVGESLDLSSMSTFLDADNGEQAISLDSVSRTAKSRSVRQRARRVLNYLAELAGGDSAAIVKSNQKYYDLTGDSLIHDYFKQYVPKYANQPLPNQSIIVKTLYDAAKNPKNKPVQMLDTYALLNRLLGVKLGPFDIRGLEKAYLDYKKRPQPLKMGKYERPSK